MAKMKQNFVTIPKNTSNRKKKWPKIEHVKRVFGFARKQKLQLAKEVTVISTHAKRSNTNVLKTLLSEHKHRLEEKPISIADITRRRPKTEFTVTGIDANEIDVEKSDELSEKSFADEDPGDRNPAPEKPVFNKEKVGDYTLYNVPQGAIMLLYANSKVFLYGILQAEVLYGKVSVLGKTLHTGCQKVVIYSPKGSVLMSITNVSESNEKTENSKESLNGSLQRYGLDEEIVREIVMFKVKQNTAILYLTNMMDKCTEFVEANFTYRLYPKMRNNLRCVFRNKTSADWNSLQINPEWTQVCNRLHTDNIIMLCGGKGVGKSTLLRYLVNQQLNTNNDVCVLDLDPGQPEFTVSGQISLVKVAAPLFGPNFTHLQTPLISMFVRNINVASDYVHYLNMIQYLMPHVRKLKTGPLIVNCMGFPKDVGLFIMACVTALVQPTVVVEITSKRENRNFRVNLKPAILREILKNTHAQVPDIQIEVNEFEWLQIDSMSRNANVIWEFEARHMRELRVLAYFSQMLPPQCSYLTEHQVQMCSVCLNDISIVFNGKQCDPSAANANLVALCAMDERTCYGWGIVRGISIETNLLYLLTPVTAELLEDVHYLMIGSGTLPQLIYVRQHHSVRGHVPYTMKGNVSQFGKSPKRTFPAKAISDPAVRMPNV